MRARDLVSLPAQAGWLIAALLSLALPAAAGAQPAAAPTTPDLRPKNYLVTALEVPLLHLIVHAGARALDRPESDVDLASIRRNLRSGWVIDEDDPRINQIGHPYQGALAFSAARSNGLTFWESVPYVIGSSVLWELFAETNTPSINDLVTTSVSGSFLGEMLHRMAAVVLASPAGTPLGREILALVVDPVGSVNRLVLGPAVSDLSPDPPFFGRIAAGGVFGARFRSKAGEIRETRLPPAFAHLGLHVLYGAPGDGWRYRRPFDYFTLDLEVAIADSTFVSLVARGLLVGEHYALGERFRGVWGVFGLYDYADPTVLRASVSALGVGTVAQHQLTENIFLQPTFILGASPLGVAGPVGGLPEASQEDVGPGAHGVLELRLTRRGLGWANIGGRGYLISGAYKGEGWSMVAQGQAGLNVRLFSRNALGVELVAAWREARGLDQLPSATQWGHLTRVYWTLYTGEGMGTVPRAAR